MKLKLIRHPEWPGGQGTPGTIIAGGPVFCYSVELPWRDNKRWVSRIPAGEYALRPYSSKRFRRVLEVADVPGRSKILLHRGNWAGDKSQGLMSDSSGCILPVYRHGWLDGQRAGLVSSVAMDAILELEPAAIEIIDAPEAL